MRFLCSSRGGIAIAGSTFLLADHQDAAVVMSSIIDRLPPLVRPTVTLELMEVDGDRFVRVATPKKLSPHWRGP